MPTSLSGLPIGNLKHDSFPHLNTSTGKTGVVSYHEPPTDVVVNQSQTERTAWGFLTLGIPKLIEAFSIFLAGIVHREPQGGSMQVWFTAQHLSQDKYFRLTKFQKIDEQTSLAINPAERAKALQLMYRIIESDASSEVKQELLKPFYDLLERNSRQLNGRNHFLESDWKAIDLIDFELMQDGLINLITIFNASWMGLATLQADMQKVFNVDYYEAVIAENLALHLAYIEDLDDKEISVPVMDKKTGQYRLASYVIRYTRIGDALPCYLLESEDRDARPWFIVRGTQPYTGLTKEGHELRVGSLESILADSFDHECISRKVINKALVRRPIVREDGHLVQKESLSDIFHRWREEGKQAKLCGHSLGGTIVNALTVEFYDQIEKTYSFSGAGVSKETAKRWDQLSASDKDKSYYSKLTNFDYEGDFIPSGGKRLIGNHYAMTSLVNERLNSLYDSHVLTHLNRDFEIQRVDISKENHKLSRHFMERVRIIVGKCFRFLLRLFSSKSIPDWWTHSKAYNIRASFERQIRLSTAIRQ